MPIINPALRHKYDTKTQIQWKNSTNTQKLNIKQTKQKLLLLLLLLLLILIIIIIIREKKYTHTIKGEEGDCNGDGDDMLYLCAPAERIYQVTDK